MTSEIVGHGSLRLESEDGLYHFISKGTETNRELLCLPEFLSLECGSADVMNEFLEGLSELRPTEDFPGRSGVRLKNIPIYQRARLRSLLGW
jgi:hypothetical protein